MRALPASLDGRLLASRGGGSGTRDLLADEAVLLFPRHSSKVSTNLGRGCETTNN
jgi:hypothetical protein